MTITAIWLIVLGNVALEGCLIAAFRRLDKLMRLPDYEEIEEAMEDLK